MDKLTKAEAVAIEALQRVARRWPKTLMLVHHADSGGLAVKRVTTSPDIASVPTIVRIEIRAEACV